MLPAHSIHIASPQLQLPPPPQPTPHHQPVADTGTIRCLCNFSDDDGETIFCDQCGFWQHMSCVGLANKPKEELPESWYCWNCKPDKFEWVQSLNGSSGDTLATSLGISQSHWNPNYVANVGLGLDIGNGVAGPSSSSPFASNRAASSSLRISNLLSPAPPPPPPPKILLDPVKAKKRQESRRVEDELLKKHQREAAHAANGVIGQNLNSANNRTDAGSSHLRKPSIAQGDKPKGRKVTSSLQAAAAVAARGGVEVLPTSSGAGPSTLAASTSTTGQRAPTVVPLVAAASTNGKRKSSAAAAPKGRNKDKDTQQQPKLITIPDSSPRFGNPATPLPSSTPRAAHLSFAPPRSPRQSTGLPTPSQRSRSRSIDHAVIGDENGDVEMMDDAYLRPMNGVGAYRDGMPSDGDDYFGSVGKGKGKEREPYPPSPMVRDGPVPTTPYMTTPYLPNGQHANAPPIPPTALRSPTAPPSYPPRPIHSVITSLGTGVKISVPQGATTASAVTKPRPLVIRSYLAAPDPSSTSPTGLALFLDPRPPLPRPLSVPTRQPLSPLSGNVPVPPSPHRLPGHDPSPSLSALALPNFPLPSLSPSALDPELPRPSSSSMTHGPNAVVRPLMCKRKGLDGSVTFGVFVMRELAAGEAISLGWEMRETLSKSVHDPTSFISTLSYIADTFITCGSCGRRTGECLPDVLKAHAEFAEVPTASDMSSILSSTSPVHGKRLRSPVEEMDDSDLQSLGDASSKRPNKRPRLADGDVTPNPTPATVTETPLPTPSTATSIDRPSPEITLGLDTTLRRLQLGPGTPVLPSPRARFRHNWKMQLERIQANQVDLVGIKPSVGLGLTSSGQYLPSTASQWHLAIPPVEISSLETVLTGKRLVNGSSDTRVQSSPLTEQSGSADENNTAVKSPRHVNGKTGGRAGKRANRVRIESTPPSDNSMEGQEPAVVQESAETSSPVAARNLGDPISIRSTSKDAPLPAHQRGPPRFRKWAPDAPRIDLPVATEIDNADTPLSRTATPVQVTTDVDGDINMDAAVSLARVQSPPRQASVPMLASFSIRSLLNPAPTKVVPRVTAEQFHHPPAQMDVHTPIARAAETEISLSPSSSLLQQNLQPTFVQTSSPALNLLLGDRPTSSERSASEVLPMPISPSAPEMPLIQESSPGMETRLPSPRAEAPITGETKNDLEENPAEAGNEEAIVHHPMEVEEIVDLLLVEEIIIEAEEDQKLEAPPATSCPVVEVSSPILAVPPPEEINATPPASPKSMEVDPPPSSPLSDAPSESHAADDDDTPKPTYMELAHSPPPVTEPVPAVVDMSPPSASAPSAELPNPVIAAETPIIADTEILPAPSPMSVSFLPVPTVHEPPPGSPVPSPAMTELGHLLHAAASPTPSSAAAQSPKPTIRKMSFADYARRRKADQEKAKRKAMETSGEGGALNLVIEEKDEEKKDEVAASSSDNPTAIASEPASHQAEIMALNEMPTEDPQLQLPLPEVAPLSSPRLQGVEETLTSSTLLPSALPDLPQVSEADAIEAVALQLPAPQTSPVVEAKARSMTPMETSNPIPELIGTVVEDGGESAPEMSVRGASVPLESVHTVGLSPKVEAEEMPVAERPSTPTRDASPFPDSPATPPREDFPEPDTPPRLPSPMSTAQIPVDSSSQPHSPSRPHSASPGSSGSSQHRSNSPQTPPLPAHRLSSLDRSEHRDSDTDDAVVLSAGPSPASPVLTDRRSSVSHRNRLVLPDVSAAGPPLNGDAASDLARQLQLAAAAGEKDRYHPAPPAPGAPTSLSQRKPPTEPRHARSLAPINTMANVPVEEGEIMSSPTASPVPLAGRGSARSNAGPSSASGPPTQPRFHRSPSVMTRGPSPPPSTTPFRPTLLSRMPPSGPRGAAGLPSGPRALRDGGSAGGPIPPRGPAGRGHGPTTPSGGWDDRERDWDARDRPLPRDDRDRERDRDRDRDRDRRWGDSPRWRGGRGRPWGR